MRSVVRCLGIITCSALLIAVSYGQDSGRVGIGVKGSLLGGGVEAAARVTHHTNIRAGFNIFDYSRSFTKDQTTYNGQLSFRTVEAHFDYFPWAKSFHLSPGVLIYAADPITAAANFSSINSFTLGGQTYWSDPNAPATANGKIDFNRASPTATFGWGNLVPRKAKKHFSVPVELGVAFQGSPKATLNVAGNLCTQQGVESSCSPAATTPTIQSNIISEQNKINNSTRFFKVYPIISVGLGYKF